MVNPAHFGIIDNQFGFVAGCFIYRLTMLPAESLKLRTLLNK